MSSGLHVIIRDHSGAQNSKSTFIPLPVLPVGYGTTPYSSKAPTCSLPPQQDEAENEVRKLIGGDKDGLISEGSREREQTSDAKPTSHRLSGAPQSPSNSHLGRQPPPSVFP